MVQSFDGNSNASWSGVKANMGGGGGDRIVPACGLDVIKKSYLIS